MRQIEEHYGFEFSNLLYHERASLFKTFIRNKLVKCSRLVGFTPDESDHCYRLFSYLLVVSGIRNRLTHPRVPDDFEVSHREVLLAFAVYAAVSGILSGSFACAATVVLGPVSLEGLSFIPYTGAQGA